MFTGIIREVGRLDAVRGDGEGARLRVRAGLAGELDDGDSVAVAGVCLTVARRDAGSFEADVMRQTLGLTTLGALAPGARVNLEPALRAADRLGGHLVQGHVDGTGAVTGSVQDGLARRLRIEAPGSLLPYVVVRGSIALDGVSLTVSAVDRGGFEVSLIPETLARTTLGELAPGERVNVEVDVIARYAERLVQGFGNEGRTQDD